MTLGQNTPVKHWPNECIIVKMLHLRRGISNLQFLLNSSFIELHVKESSDIQRIPNFNGLMFFHLLRWPVVSSSSCDCSRCSNLLLVGLVVKTALRLIFNLTNFVLIKTFFINVAKLDKVFCPGGTYKIPFLINSSKDIIGRWL